MTYLGVIFSITAVISFILFSYFALKPYSVRHDYCNNIMEKYRMRAGWIWPGGKKRIYSILDSRDQHELQLKTDYFPNEKVKDTFYGDLTCHEALWIWYQIIHYGSMDERRERKEAKNKIMSKPE